MSIIDKVLQGAFSWGWRNPNKGPGLLGVGEYEKLVLNNLTPDELAKRGDWFHAHADLKRALFRLQAAKDRKS